MAHGGDRSGVGGSGEETKDFRQEFRGSVGVEHVQRAVAKGKSVEERWDGGRGFVIFKWGDFDAAGTRVCECQSLFWVSPVRARPSP
jgi:hypothetical protein